MRKLMVVGIVCVFAGSFLLGYGLCPANVRRYEILHVDLNSGVEIACAPQFGSTYVWWDNIQYNIIATRSIPCNKGDVLRIREIIKPSDWKGYNAEIFIFLKAYYAATPIAIYNGEDVAMKRSGQTYIGDSTYIDIWLTSPLSLQELTEKNYFGNWSIKLDYSYEIAADHFIEKTAGFSLIPIGTLLCIIHPLQTWKIKRRKEQIDTYF
jgi:hypothetical protein